MKRVPKGHDHSTKTQIVELKDAEVLKNHGEWEWREYTVVIIQSNWELLMWGHLSTHSLLLQTPTNRENHGQLHSKPEDIKCNVCTEDT